MSHVEQPGANEHAEHGTSAPRPRRGRRIAIALLALAMLLGAAGAWFYFAHLHYRPSAHLHIPANALLAVRANAAEIVLFRPVRKHLWPLVTDRLLETDERPEQPASGGRLERLAELSGIHIPRDLREVVVASVEPTSWVVLAGGTLRRGAFVPGVEQLLREEGRSGWSRQGDLLVHLLGFTLAQAEDGTLIAGTTEGVVRAALPESADDGRVPVPIEGALSFRADAELWSGVIGLLPGSLPGLSTLSQVGGASGSFTLGDEPHVRLTLTPKPDVTADALRGEIDRLLTAARLLTLLSSDDLGGAKQALGAASVAATASTVEIAAPWPIEPLDRAVERLAHRLRGGADAGVAPSRAWPLF